MSTINVAYNNAAWTVLGVPTDNGDFDSGAGQYEFDIGVVGSSIGVRLFGTQSCDVWVDGVHSSISGPGSGWNYVTVSLGTDASHVIKIAPNFWNKGNAGDNNVLQVTGGTPSVASAFGTIYQSSNFSGHFIADGESSVEGAGNILWPQGGCGLRFDATITAMTLYVRGDSGPFIVCVDGNFTSPVASFTPSGGSSWSSYTVSGLSGAHSYEILPIGTSTAIATQGQPLRLWMVCFGAGETVTANTQAAKSNVVLYGDSIAGADNATDMRNSDHFLICRQWGYSAIMKSNVSQPVDTYLRDNTSQVTSLSSVIAVILQGGRNDVSITQEPEGTFQTAYQTMVTNVRGAGGSFATVPIYCRKILPRVEANEPGNTYTILNSFNAGIDAVVAALADANTTSIDVSAGWDPSTDITTDPHPNDIGYALVYVNESEAIGPKKPTIGTATANSSSQITVAWTSNDVSNDGFNIRYSTDSSFSTGVSTATASSGVTSKAITGLTASTTYYFQVQSKSNSFARVSLLSASANATTNSSGPSVSSATVDATGGNLTLALAGTGPFTFTGGATTLSGLSNSTSLFASATGGITIAATNATISGSNITCGLAFPIGLGQTVAIDSHNLHGLQDGSSTTVPSFSALSITNNSNLTASTPSNFTLTPQGTPRVVVSWLGINANENLKVFRGPDAGNLTLLATVTNGGTFYLDNAVSNGTQYFYNATAEYRSSGHVSNATAVLSTTPPAGNLATITVGNANVIPGGNVTISATAFGTTGGAMNPQPSLTWSLVSGNGTINSSTGLFTAPASPETDTVRATSGSIHGDATVNVVLGSNALGQNMLLLFSP